MSARLSVTLVNCIETSEHILKLLYNRQDRPRRFYRVGQKVRKKFNYYHSKDFLLFPVSVL